MANRWNGSMNSSTILSDGHIQEIKDIEYALDAVNLNDTSSATMDLKLMGNMITEREGVEGTYELYKTYAPLFQDEGSMLDAKEYKKSYSSFNFTRKGFEIKNGSFDAATYQDMIERKQNPNEEIADRTIAIIGTYEQYYKPNVIFDTLLTVPEDGLGAQYEFGDNFGVIRNYKINSQKLINYDEDAVDGDIDSDVRNNWRTIELNTGITNDDMTFYKEYMGNVEGVDEEGLYVFGTSSAIGQLAGIFSDFSETTEQILLNGVETSLTRLNGFALITVKWLPKNTLMILNPDANNLITKLVSPEPSYRDLYIEFPTGKGEKFLKDAESFEGAILKIGKEGHHLTGVLDAMFVDIAKENYSADRIAKSEKTGSMKDTIFTRVFTKQASLAKKWYGSVTEVA